MKHFSLIIILKLLYSIIKKKTGFALKALISLVCFMFFFTYVKTNSIRYVFNKTSVTD